MAQFVIILLETLKTTFSSNEAILLKKRIAAAKELIQFWIPRIDYYPKWNIVEI